MRSTARTPSTASSGCRPRARSSCIQVPTPPKRDQRRRAPRQSAMTKPSMRRPAASDATAPARPPMPATHQARTRLPGAPREQRGARHAAGTNPDSAAPAARCTYCLRPDPEDHRGDEHQHAGNAERARWRRSCCRKMRHQQRGEERAEVDDPVEGVEDDLGQVLVASGRTGRRTNDDDQRLDAARAERDQEQAGVEAGAVVLEHRQAGVAGAVDQADSQRMVWYLPKKRSDEPAAQQREEVHADHEGVEDLLGRAGALGLAAGTAAATSTRNGVRMLRIP